MESGQLITGRYRLREQLGRGGMAVVWRADDEVLGREVAVKVLAPALAGDPDLRQRIRDEARAAARLRHVNVVAVYDYGEFADAGHTLSYVVMELVDGRTLADMLTGGGLPWKVAVLVGAQVAAALAAAHADGIVHRDVKPANIMVTSSGVKLVDFGISAAVGVLDGQDGQVLGTPAYLAPERIAGGPVRPATDVYALGLVLHLALAGRMPWDASTVTQMVRAHVYATPAPLPRIAGLPPAVSRLVARCLTKNPADRPSSIEVSEVLGELAGLPPAALLRSAAGPTLSLPSAAARKPPSAPARKLLSAPAWLLSPAPAQKTAAQKTAAQNAAAQNTAAQNTAAHKTAARRPARKLLVAAGVAAGMLTAGGAWWVDSRPAPPAQAAAAPAGSPATSATKQPATSAAKRPATTAAKAPATTQAAAPSAARANVRTIALTKRPAPPKAEPKGKAKAPKAKPKAPKKPAKPKPGKK
ncbi:serine/threonine-protein kinase [Paractinoplanes atraurantiacus]|uniref:serine/threonine-protein kinase n=1 Tax=Paractinoplanes atraurantiacus TaxID=1036182 RepID=UPI0015CF1D55|nr:serine/threonine-protein kinase [Actinoplanes atraurantiacus]